MTKLRQCGNQWNFHNESELEDLVWTHLKSLLGLLPLKRQFLIRGQFCDILARCLYVEDELIYSSRNQVNLCAAETIRVWCED